MPDEKDVFALLLDLHEFANRLIFGSSAPPTKVDTAKAILDDLQEPDGLKDTISSAQLTSSASMPIAFRLRTEESVAKLAYELLRDHKVFITPRALDIYTRIQCLLGRPKYIPEIFFLYANKDIPIAKSSPIKYKKPNPNSSRNAIPIELSDAALQAAINKKDMQLAIAIIDTTVALRAYRIAKTIRKASLPALALFATPAIAYSGAHWVSTYQNVWDPEMAKYTTMAGALAYIGTLSTIGFVAITTWNDQMQRVVWALGTPLTYRWWHEEERAYFDRIAMAWGFQERWRRGEEQGEEWEMLRETVGQRSMILDRTELMDGME